jgi:DNA-binding transcriptional LysR family regulator
MLAEFSAKYPKIHIELVLTARTVDMVGEGFDLALRGGKLADSTLIARRAGATDLAIFGSHEYLKQNGRPETLASLTMHRCVIYRARGGRATWTLTGPNGEESVEVSGPLSVDHLAFVARAAAAGMGLALLPTPLVRGFGVGKSLEVVLPEYSVRGAALHVVLPSSAFVPIRVALLRDFLVERLSEEISHATKACEGRCQDERSGHRAASGRRKMSSRRR